MFIWLLLTIFRLLLTAVFEGCQIQQDSSSRGRYAIITLKIRERVIDNVVKLDMKQVDIAKLLRINTLLL